MDQLHDHRGQLLWGSETPYSKDAFVGAMVCAGGHCAALLHCHRPSARDASFANEHPNLRQASHAHSIEESKNPMPWPHTRYSHTHEHMLAEAVLVQAIEAQ
jgi:hypothetical protein